MNKELVSNQSIKVHDSFAAFLGGPADVENFSISIIDAARLAGHLCPSIAGAFVMTRAAVKALFPKTNTCERGQVKIDVAGAANEGVLGPITQVMTYITGACAENGFGGLQGEFVRRNLLSYNSKKVSPGVFRFERIDTGEVIEVSYHPNRAKTSNSVTQIEAILTTPEVIEIHEV